MTLYKQTETKYKSIKMGFGTSSIYDYGCYLVSLCNGLNEVGGWKFTPESFNELLKEKKLFVGEFKNYIDIENLSKKLPDVFIKAETYWSYPTDDILKEALQKDRVVVAQVDARGIGGSGTHFVLVLRFEGNTAIIYDPWYGEETKVTKRYSKYGNLLGLRIFTIKTWEKPNAEKTECEKRIEVLEDNLEKKIDELIDETERNKKLEKEIEKNKADYKDKEKYLKLEITNLQKKLSNEIGIRERAEQQAYALDIANSELLKEKETYIKQEEAYKLEIDEIKKQSIQNFNRIELLLSAIFGRGK